jgi:hypothetical protein
LTDDERKFIYIMQVLDVIKFAAVVGCFIEITKISSRIWKGAAILPCFVLFVIGSIVSLTGEMLFFRINHSSKGFIHGSMKLYLVRVILFHNTIICTVPLLRFAGLLAILVYCNSYDGKFVGVLDNVSIYVSVLYFIISFCDIFAGNLGLLSDL